MYYRKTGETKWTRCTCAHYISSGLSDLVREGKAEIKYARPDTQKQRRQKKIASALRSLSCAVQQLNSAARELDSITLENCPDWMPKYVRDVRDSIKNRVTLVVLSEQETRLLNKYVALANKESKTP